MCKFVKENKEQIIKILIILIISKIIFLVSMYIGFQYLPKGNYDHIKSIKDIFFKWNDVGNYLAIARTGYIENHYYAFAPLYPIMIKLFSYIFKGSYEISGLFVTNISFIIVIFLLYYYLTFFISQNSSMYSVIALILYPASIYNTILYTESLYILMITISVLAYHKKEYMISACFCGLSILTRINGIALLVGYGLDMFITFIKEKDYSYKSIISLLKKGLGFLAVVLAFYGIWLIYMYAKKDNLFFFLEAQKSWGRETPNLFIIPFLIELFIRIFKFPALRTALEFLLPLIMLVFSALNLKNKKIPIYIIIYSIFTIIMPLATRSTWSLTRLPMVALAAYIFVGTQSDKNRKFRIIYFIITVILYIIFSGSMGQLRGTYI